MVEIFFAKRLKEMEDRYLKINKLDLIKLILDANEISGNAKSVLIDMVMNSTNGLSLIFNSSRASYITGLKRKAVNRLYQEMLMEGLYYSPKFDGKNYHVSLNFAYFEEIYEKSDRRHVEHWWSEMIHQVGQKGTAGGLKRDTTTKSYNPKADTSYCELKYLLTWNLWLDYRESIGEQYNNEYVAKINCENLSKWACGKKYFAEAIVKKAISNGWKNFYALKEEEKELILQNRTEDERLTDLGYKKINGEWSKNGMKRY